jgi:hypothetical protein
MPQHIGALSTLIEISPIRHTKNHPAHSPPELASPTGEDRFRFDTTLHQHRGLAYCEKTA